MGFRFLVHAMAAALSLPLTGKKLDRDDRAVICGRGISSVSTQRLIDPVHKVGYRNVSAIYEQMGKAIPSKLFSLHVERLGDAIRGQEEAIPGGERNVFRLPSRVRLDS